MGLTLVCAGKLSLLVPPVGALSSAASLKTSAEPPRLPCHVRCDGVSLRFEKVVPSGNKDVVDTNGGAATHTSQSEQLLQAAGSVAGRASLIVLALRNCDRNVGMQHYATGTVQAASQICAQAGKIVKRSAEHLGHAVSYPWQLIGG